MGKYRATRVPIDLPVVVEVGTRVSECRASNISLGGMFIAGMTLAIDAPLSVLFAAPPHLPELRVACTARWSTVEGTGVRFDDLSPADVERLAQVIRGVLADMH